MHRISFDIPMEQRDTPFVYRLESPATREPGDADINERDIVAILREWIVRLWGTLHPGRKDGDLEQELRLHAELAAEDMRRGRSPESGTRAVAIGSGVIAHAMEVLRDQRGLPWLDDLVRDVRHAGRL